MADSVIVIVANDAYSSQVKSLMVNCVRQGRWKGDFCLVHANDNPAVFAVAPSPFRLTGTVACKPNAADPHGFCFRDIHVMIAPDKQWSMLTKFHIFSRYFKKWKRVLCLDCDILIQNDLHAACDGMAKQFPAILFDGSSPGSIVHNWRHFDSLHGDGPDAHPELYEQMREEFPHIDSQILTADVIFFDPSTVEPGTVETLQATAEKYIRANRGRTDQPVYNLVLYDKMAPITKDFCTWFAFDDPANRVADEARGWRGDEFPAIIHYWNMYAPWIVKEEGAGGYRNERLGRVCHELYEENLAAFDEVFPVT